MKYKAVILDLDGTLLDTTSGVIEAVKKTIVQVGLQIPSANILKLFVGPPMQESFSKHFALNNDIALEYANIFRKNYGEGYIYIADLYPNVMETLQIIKNKGYRIALATNKSHENAMNILEKFKIDEFCDFAMGSDLKGLLKKKDIIKQCLQEINVNPSEAVYIGDSFYDLEGAEANGMDFIGVSYGFGFQKGDSIYNQLIKRSACVDDFSEVIEFI
ncbi:MAG: HAD-IIIA family hydrolase [Bacillota bacterium]